jgi:hypothetical protein
MPTPSSVLLGWLEPRLTPSARSWLDGRIAALEGNASDRDVLLAFAMVPRKLGKADLGLSADELVEADAVRPGWDPCEWSIDQAARLALLLTVGSKDADRLVRLIEDLFATADVGELICLYRGLPLFPAQERYLARAREGARTNMRAVFEALAHRSPYPKEQFADPAWNQMVVKALFVGSALWPIQGVDERRNEDLAVMLLDYAHERRAAGRSVTPELWRCVGPFARGAAIDELKQVVQGGSTLEQKAAALALAESPEPRAGLDAVHSLRPDLASAIAAGELNWSRIRP